MSEQSQIDKCREEVASKEAALQDAMSTGQRSTCHRSQLGPLDHLRRASDATAGQMMVGSLGGAP